MRLIFLFVLVTMVVSEDNLGSSGKGPNMKILTKYSQLTDYQQNNLLTTPQYSNCYPSNVPHLYSGTMNKTEGGLKCQKWVSHFPHNHTFDGWSFHDGYLPHNYCRAVKGDTKRRGRPWCLTENPDKEWEYCPVPSCHPNVGFCVNKMPGLDGFSSGINLLEFDLFDVTAGRKGVVFDFTCYYDWMDIFEGDTYVQPDQIGFFMQKDKGSLSNNAEIIKTMLDLTESRQGSISVSGSYGPVTGSLSAKYKEYERTIKKGQYFVTRSMGKEVTAEARLVKGSELPLGAEFKEDMNALPNKFDQNEDAYNRFILKYGTHYIKEALFGGMVEVVSVVSSEFLKTHSEKELGIAASFQYDKLVSVSADAEYSENEKKLNEAFKKSSKTESTYYGGDVNFNKDGITEWQQSVKTNPVMTKVKVDYLSELFPDVEQREQMAIAIDKYFTTRLKCPKGWWRQENHCFFYNGDSLTWQQANAACRKLNARLPSTRNAKENALIAEVGGYHANINTYWFIQVWLNAQDSVSEDVWVWQDTMRPISWTNWYSFKEPKGGVDMNCLQIACTNVYELERYHQRLEDAGMNDYGNVEEYGPFQVNGNWTAENCSTKNKYICMKPLAPE